VKGLWWLLLWVSLAVFAVVLALMATSVLRARTGDRDTPDESEPRWASRFIVTTGVVVPFLVLTGVFVVSLADVRALADDPTEDILTVTVTGHMWWWEAEYPNGAVTANEIHIPVGQPVRFELESADVIHSFWVPALGPKRDMIPGQTNTLRLTADEPGRYRGQCAEFCGVQHARMGLYVVADSEYDSWVEQMAAEAPSPADPTTSAGRDLFLAGSCAGCHAIRGTDANARVGPDLTHIASRQTIGAASYDNTHENLTRFVTDAQSLKPGIVMPPAELSHDEIAQVVAYLETLQ
jgi:cytochrome c oxidase subunit 2